MTFPENEANTVLNQNVNDAKKTESEIRTLIQELNRRMTKIENNHWLLNKNARTKK